MWRYLLIFLGAFSSEVFIAGWTVTLTRGNIWGVLICTLMVSTINKLLVASWVADRRLMIPDTLGELAGSMLVVIWVAGQLS